MANTKSLNKNQRKNAKMVARKKNKQLINKLGKKDRRKFLTQIRDKKAKSKDGIVSFVQKLKEEEKKKENVSLENKNKEENSKD